jgi:hypothetical protein
LGRRLISTYEQVPTHDPDDVTTAHPSDPCNLKWDFLFPLLLSKPLRRNPTPSESRSGPSQKVHGFPIRWSRPGFMWLPYLPAVISYHYPLFRGMNMNPRIVPGADGGFVLDPDVVTHWTNIEHVLSRVINNLKQDAFTCSHKFPYFPSSYGYRGSFPKRQKAKNAITPTLHAFQHMLAYSSYLMSSVGSPNFLEPGCKAWYEDPEKAGSFIDSFTPVNQPDSSHILLKLLWSTLGEIRKARNFIGVVVTHETPYDFSSVQAMHNYGVPVYVSWSHVRRSKSYSEYPFDSLLLPWLPPEDRFEPFDLPRYPTHPLPDAPPPPVPIDRPTTSSIQQPPHSSDVDLDPWRYVERRKASIASRTYKPQQWLSREEAARSFHPPGRTGALVYRFELSDVDESAAGSVQKWKRVLLTRANAQVFWNHANPRNLW